VDGQPVQSGTICKISSVGEGRSFTTRFVVLKAPANPAERALWELGAFTKRRRPTAESVPDPEGTSEWAVEKYRGDQLVAKVMGGSREKNGVYSVVISAWWIDATLSPGEAAEIAAEIRSCGDVVSLT